MQVAPEHTAWQWRPKATLTAADTCALCTVFALQYTDCAVLRVRKGPSLMEPQVDDELVNDGVASQDLELHGHINRITCVRVRAGKSRCVKSVVTICSASIDCVIVWHVGEFDRVTQSIVVENLPAEPGWLAFDDTGTLVAIASDRNVKVFVVERKEVLVTLEGHLARVTKGEFHPIHHHLLVTSSEDRTFKIWDLAAKTLWFQSAVLSAFAILSVALNPVNGDAAFGFADGSIKIFALVDSYAKERATLSVEAFIRKSLQRKQEAEEEAARETPNVISSLPRWARSEKAQQEVSTPGFMGSSYGAVDSSLPTTDGTVNTEVSCPALAMTYMCAKLRGSPNAGGDASPATRELRFNSHEVRELLDYEQFLVVGVPRFLLSMNAYSFELSVVQDFQDTILPVDSVCVAKDFCFYCSPRSKTLRCGVLSAFQLCFTMFSVSTPSTHNSTTSSSKAQSPWRDAATYSSSSVLTHDSHDSSDNNSGENVSVIPSGPPPKDSVLTLPPLATKKSTPPKGAKNLDKPVTFHSCVRSSGYGTAPAFKAKRTPPKTRGGLSSRKGKLEFGLKTRASTPPPTSMESYLREYPINCGLLQHFQDKHALPPHTLHRGAILHVEYSSDAKWLATSGADRVAQACRLPFSRFKGDGNVFAGHDQAVRRIHWSHNDRMLVTTAGDKTSRLWLAESDTPSLIFQGNSNKKAVKQELADALFFYMDKFLLSACTNTVRLHQFELDELYALSAKASKPGTRQQRRSDVEVLENRSRKRRVALWRFDDMQSVTSLACVNGAFLSPVVVLAGSDRSLRVLDAGVGHVVRVMRDAHSRAALTVTLPRPSCFASHASNLYDLLLSSAPDNTTHLWDVRADNCVMRFSEHRNRVHALEAAFSPCMRYVATGSEDRAAHIYDIRTGRRLAKLQGHTDVVTSVAFNPLHPQLATSSCDGTVRFYSCNQLE